MSIGSSANDAKQPMIFKMHPQLAGQRSINGTCLDKVDNSVEIKRVRDVQNEIHRQSAEQKIIRVFTKSVTKNLEKFEAKKNRF
jgi:hypothetical protein